MPINARNRQRNQNEEKQRMKEITVPKRLDNILNMVCRKFNCSRAAAFDFVCNAAFEQVNVMAVGDVYKVTNFEIQWRLVPAVTKIPYAAKFKVASKY